MIQFFVTSVDTETLGWETTQYGEEYSPFFLGKFCDV